jgi:hypothetical protein
MSIGSEIHITTFLFTRFGFLTDNSSAPGTATAASNAISPAQINRLGFSASVGGAKNGKGLSAGVSLLFGKGTGNGLDFRREAFDNDTTFIRVPVKERIFIISIGGDIGQTADVVKAHVKEKKTEEQLEAEEAEERQERQQDMQEETEGGQGACYRGAATSRGSRAASQRSGRRGPGARGAKRDSGPRPGRSRSAPRHHGNRNQHASMIELLHLQPRYEGLSIQASRAAHSDSQAVTSQSLSVTH